MTAAGEAERALVGPTPASAHEFHRMALISGQHRWWRPITGTVVVLVGYLLLSVVPMGAYEIAKSVAGRPADADGMHMWDGIGETASLLLSLATLIPAVFLAARWVQRRPAGTVSSVAGRLRWRWLGTCLALALPLAGGLGIAFFLLEPSVEGNGTEELTWVGLPSFLMGLVMVCSLVPFQAAAEEYAFRGWLLQAVGAHVRSPWIAVLPQSVLFAAAHGWGTPWGFASLVVMGLAMGVVTIRTGGLEAAIAVHVLNNLVMFGIAAGVVGGLESDETAADSDWTLAAVAVAVVLVYTVVVLWMARRRISAVSTSGEATGIATDDLDVGGRGRVWAAVEVVVAVVCALGAAGLSWWLGWPGLWWLAAKAAVLGSAGLVGGVLWVGQRRKRAKNSEE